MILSLRQELDKIPEHEAISEVEEAMFANNEVSCGIKNCNFKITRKEMEDNFQNDCEEVSNKLWDHRYSHCRKYKKRIK